MVKKVLYVSGTRADYGLMVTVLRDIDACPQLNLEIVATGLHLMPEFGLTINEVRNSGFKLHEVDATYDRDTKASMACFCGKFIQKFTARMVDLKPDVILLLGDRAEMLAAAIVGTYLDIAVAHVHGGDISSTVDEPVRHAITKLAHVHFPATKRSAERLTNTGEEGWRVHCVGSPAIDAIASAQFTDPKKLAAKYDLDVSEPVLLAIQHPVSNEYRAASEQIRTTLDALVETGYQTVLIFPNADAGGRAIIEALNAYKSIKQFRQFKSISRSDYLGLLSLASVMVGNSSSGIIEAPSFQLPAVNIGTRQEGRERACNVIDARYDKSEIVAAINFALFDADLRECLRTCRNPYGDGAAGKRIVKVLKDLEISDQLLRKRLVS